MFELEMPDEGPEVTEKVRVGDVLKTAMDLIFVGIKNKNNVAKNAKAHFVNIINTNLIVLIVEGHAFVSINDIKIFAKLSLKL